MRWKHISQKYYSKNMSLMLLRHIGVAYMKPAKLHKVGAMEFKAPESCCHSNYIYLHQRLLSIHTGFYPSTFLYSCFFPKDWVSVIFAKLVGFFESIFEIWVSRSLENAFLTHFLTSNHTLFIADKHHFPHEYYGLVIK